MKKTSQGMEQRTGGRGTNGSEICIAYTGTTFVLSFGAGITNVVLFGQINYDAANDEKGRMVA